MKRRLVTAPPAYRGVETERKPDRHRAVTRTAGRLIQDVGSAARSGAARVRVRPHHLTLSFSRVAIALTAALCLALPPAKAAPTQASTATARTSLVLPPEPQLALEEVRLEYVDSAGRPRGERDMRLVRRSERFEAGARVIELRFVDSVSGVSLTRAYRVSGTGGTPTVERTGALRNEGRAPISLLRFETLHLDLPAARGGWLAQLATPDYGYSHRMIGPGAPLVIQGPVAGQALEYIPGMVLTQPAGGGGLYAGVSWSTGFHFEVSTADSTHALLRVSESVDGLTLGSGEALNAPPVFLGAYEGTLADGTQALRHAVQSLQRSTRLTAPLVTWNSWFAYDRYVDGASLRAEAAVAASLGVEVFYVDHGWQRLNG